MVKQSGAERINKYLAGLGVAARRKIDAMVLNGEIMVNGEVATLGQMVTSGKDVITIKGRPVLETPETVQQKYFALYKPVGVVSSVTDPENRPTVLKYFKNQKARLYPVGRLDQASEGLILVTNDGELAQRVTHPSFHLPKTYLVWISGEVTPRKLDMLRRGVRLKDGVTAPCEIDATQIDTRRWSFLMTLREGKNRQIRRMLPHVELEVLKLKRIQFGPVSLGGLQPGEYRALSASELQLLRQRAGLAK